ncbi:MAG: HigA family addiction module antitoxin [Chloroflexota bacterium]
MEEIRSPIHPGKVLLEDFMKPLGLSQYRLAQDIGVSPIRISQIVNGQRSITVDTAMRLARYFGTSLPITPLRVGFFVERIILTRPDKRL